MRRHKEEQEAVMVSAELSPSGLPPYSAAALLLW